MASSCVNGDTYSAIQVQDSICVLLFALSIMDATFSDDYAIPSTRTIHYLERTTGPPIKYRIRLTNSRNHGPDVFHKSDPLL